MATDGWRPLSVRMNGTAQQYDALHEGVPDWLQPSLMIWITAHFLGPERKPNLAALQTVQLTLRRGLGDFLGTRPQTSWVNLIRMMRDDPNIFLDVIDLALEENEGTESEGLEIFLRTGGSAWSVSPDGLALTRRVLPEIAEAARVEVEQAERAGELLGQAWRYVYGRDPNPSEGYHKAVNAIEAAAIPVITPNDLRATLGRVNGHLRANKERFTTVFLEAEKGVEAALELMEVVWKSHHDRHGTPDETMPISVSQEEAEAALHAALLLVHWFRTRLVRSE